MSVLSNLSAGRDVPNDFNVLIEIPAEGPPVKYEIDKDSGLLLVDRFMPCAMHYPCNYGFIPKTLSEDGDPADVLVLAPQPIYPGSMVRCRALGVLNMTDEAGVDCKILAVPIEKVCSEYRHIQNLEDVGKGLLNRIVHFFETYKVLEPNKWVKVSGWAGKAEAEQEILKSIKMYGDSAA